MASHVVETIMQLTPGRYATATAAAVLGAGLIAVTPLAVPNTEQRAVGLTAAGDVLDLVTLAPGGGSFSGALADELPLLGDLGDAGVAEATWIDALLVGAVILYQIVGVWAINLYDWFIREPLNWVLSLFGLEPLPFALEGLGVGFDFALPAEASTAPEEITSLLSGARGALDATTLAQDLSTALDPGDLTSIPDPSAMADFGTAFDTAGLADIDTLLSAALIADIGI